MDAWTSFLPWLWVALGFIVIVVGMAASISIYRRSKRVVRENRRVRPDSPRPSNEVEVAPVRSVPMITLAQVRSFYSKQQTQWDERSNLNKKRLAELKSLSLETTPADDVLELASSGERENLATILGLPISTSPVELVQALRKEGSHALGTLIGNKFVSYNRVASDVAVKLGAPQPAPNATAAQIERAVVGAALQKVLDKATPAQRLALLQELAKSQATSSKALVTTTGGLILAHLSGFGLYMAASSTLAAVTGVVGLTLPFAAYTTMSGLIATIIGPLGWAALAAWAAFKLGGTNYKKTVPGVIGIATIRARLIAERDKSRMELVHERDVVLTPEFRRIEALRKFVERTRRMDAEDSVPKHDVPLHYE